MKNTLIPTKFASICSFNNILTKILYKLEIENIRGGHIMKGQKKFMSCV